MGQDPAEVFDVVDAADRVVGRETRATVHALGLRHRAVHILVEDPQGRIYLQMRSGTKDTFPNCWDSSCSGHLDAGESYKAAAVRELWEELALSARAADLEEVLRIAAREETGMEFVRVYRHRTEEEPVPNPAEIETGRWLEPSEVDALIGCEPGQVAPALVYLWRQLRVSGGGDAA